MTCDELLLRLTDFGDGALSEALCEDVRRHLAECHACTELQDDLAALARLCRECTPPRLPADLRQRLAERIGRGKVGDR